MTMDRYDGGGGGGGHIVLDYLSHFLACAGVNSQRRKRCSICQRAYGDRCTVGQSGLKVRQN